VKNDRDVNALDGYIVLNGLVREEPTIQLRVSLLTIVVSLGIYLLRNTILWQGILTERLTDYGANRRMYRKTDGNRRIGLENFAERNFCKG
jgi:hypothetical protein